VTGRRDRVRQTHLHRPVAVTGPVLKGLTSF